MSVQLNVEPALPACSQPLQSCTVSPVTSAVDVHAVSADVQLNVTAECVADVNERCPSDCNVSGVQVVQNASTVEPADATILHVHDQNVGQSKVSNFVSYLFSVQVFSRVVKIVNFL